MTRYLLGLGSNLGDRKQTLLRAVQLLSPDIAVIACSDIYESRALLPVGAPEEWDLPYLNMCLFASSELDPVNLMRATQHVERVVGGERSAVKWSPRELDIDILLAESIIIERKDLQIPHPELVHRDFALFPALQVWPDAFHPKEKKFLRELAGELSSGLRKINIYTEA